MLTTLLLATALLTGCSSAPKGQAEILTQRRGALDQLEAANKEADRGNYANALILINESRRLAISADDPSLIIRSGLSRGNILAYMNRAAESRADFDLALSEAERIGNPELAALSRVYIARSRLLAAQTEGAGAANSIAEEIRTQLRKDLGLIKTERNGAALGWTVIALAEKELGRWSEAENALKQALDIHLKGGYLELAAYDWYLTASIRSVSGQYLPALAALEEALGLDRRAENSYGLGMDWRVMGDIYKKQGNSAAADIAYRRAADIFAAIHMKKEAADAENRIGQ
jgi:tetratricopeptide (TPR) repeat protein